jgi:hypothetical protein
VAELFSVLELCRSIVFEDSRKDLLLQKIEVERRSIEFWSKSSLPLQPISGSAFVSERLTELNMELSSIISNERKNLKRLKQAITRAFPHYKDKNCLSNIYQWK